MRLADTDKAMTRKKYETLNALQSDRPAAVRDRRLDDMDGPAALESRTGTIRKPEGNLDDPFPVG